MSLWICLSNGTSRRVKGKVLLLLLLLFLICWQCQLDTRKQTTRACRLLWYSSLLAYEGGITSICKSREVMERNQFGTTWIRYRIGKKYVLWIPWSPHPYLLPFYHLPSQWIFQQWVKQICRLFLSQSGSIHSLLSLIFSMEGSRVV